MGFAAAGHGQTSLAWDANKEADLSGYIVHYGIQPGTYIYSYKIPISSLSDIEKPTAVIQGLLPGTYYYVVSAYNKQGGESDYSNMVEDTFTIPSTPQNLHKITVTVQIEE